VSSGVENNTEQRTAKAIENNIEGDKLEGKERVLEVMSDAK